MAFAGLRRLCYDHSIMALDPLEKDHLRRKMADRMGIFLESAKAVSCVSGHHYDELRPCELCQATHADELLVIKNRSGKKMIVAVACLKEMIRFQVVVDVEDLGRWLDKIKELRSESEKRKVGQQAARDEERKRLEKKVIVRKRPVTQGAS